jgi:uncharacterized protein YhaN
MHIERLEIETFGGLVQVTIADLGRGVQVLHGTNEVGKTSLLEFVRAIFFGFEGLFRRGVLDPQVPCSGRLVVAIGRGPRGDREQHRFSIERRHEGPGIATLTQASYEDGIVGLGGDEGDLVTIERLDAGEDHNQRIYLQDLVGDIDETTFTNVMAFGLDELHELRTLEPEGCGSRLYELANGLDRSRVAGTLRHIEEAISRLETGDAQGESPRDVLSRQRRDLLAALEADQTASTVGDLFIEQSRLEREAESLTQAVTRSRRAEAIAREAIPAAERHAAWRNLEDELDSLKKVALVHPDYDGWRQDNKRRRRQARLTEKRRQDRRRLARELAALPAETVIWEKRAAISSLCDERSQVERLVSDASRAEAHARLAARRFGEQVGLCGLSKVVAVDPPDASDDGMSMLLPEGLSLSFGPLRNRARNCKAASRAIAKARKQVSRAKAKLEQIKSRVAGAESALGGLTLPTAIETASEQAMALRKRITLGERLDELKQTTARLEQEMGRQLTAQVLPLGWLLGLGGVFVVGAGMLLSGLLLPAVVTGPLAYVIAALGLAGTGIASVMTWSLDRSSTMRLEETRRQHALAQQQQAETTSQCEALDKTIDQTGRRLAAAAADHTQAGLGSPASLPADGLERRAALAEAEVARLEHQAGREGSVRVYADRLANARADLKRAAERRKKAVSRWQKSLESRGLPATLSPAEVWRIGTHRHELLTLDDDRRRLSDEARHKREELTAVARRIDAVLVDCDLVPEGTPLDQLQLLEDLLNAQRRSHDQRQSIIRKLERARLRHRQAIRQLRACDRSLQGWLDRWEAADEDAFLSHVDRRPYFEKLQQEAELAERAWLDSRARFAEPQTLDNWLTKTNELSLEQRLQDAEAATAELEGTLAENRQRQAALAEAIEKARTARGLEDRQRELAEVERALADHDSRLRLLKRTHDLLEETRAEVARHHQPAALLEASHWLNRLTDGRYTRITTAVDEPRLDVHDASGVIWNPERLSRGTREQVFLALRLALVRDLHEHGISLPVVMDDALVNFDDQRARAASRTLVEFMEDQSGDHQMLVLTCHAHVARLFTDAGASVRTLAGASARKPGGSTQPDGRPEEDTTSSPAPSGQREHWAAEDFFFGDNPDQPTRKPRRRRKKRPE